MRVRLKLFAAARDRVGTERLDLELPEGATIGQLRQRLSDDHPQLSGLLPHVHFAIGTQYAADGATIPLDADVACIPPVSGG